MDHTQNMPTKFRQQTHHEITWIDIQSPTEEDFARLEQTYRLHPVHLNESIQKVQHTEVEREAHYLFLVLHFPVYDHETDKIFVHQVGVFLGKDYLITLRTGMSKVVDRLFEQARHDSSHAKKYFGQGPAFLLYILIGNLLDNISAMAEQIELELDEIEDPVFNNTRSDAQRIGKLRQKIVRLRRLIGPKRFVLKDLTEQIDSFSGQDIAKYYSNNTKTVNKLWEVVEEAKESVEIYKDADFTTSTEHTNQILAVMTLLFTFTIPITVFGTIYGMNVPLPGGIQSGAWSFFGSFTTFMLILGASTFTAIAMFVYFKRKRWF